MGIHREVRLLVEAGFRVATPNIRGGRTSSSRMMQP
jgi:hypothetical protein